MAEKTSQRAGQETASAMGRSLEARNAGEAAPAALFFNLQQTHGNRFVQDVLRGAVLQRKCDCGGSCSSCRDDRDLQVHRAGNGDPKPDSPAASVRAALNSPGYPLDAGALAMMRSRFGSASFQINSPARSATQTKMQISQPEDGSEREADQIADRVMRSSEHHSPAQPSPNHDFSHVRVHTDSSAARSAKDVGALAYTVGHDIVFASGQYAPETSAGQRLLAHELAHVIQQSGSTGGTNIQRQSEDAGTAPAPAPETAPPANQLSDEMLTQIARRLREALTSWNTDEDAIYAALTGRTEEQVAAISAKYEAMYSRTLADDLRRELSASEFAHATSISGVSAPVPEGQNPADAAAATLHRAMRGLGTDESSIFAVLTGRTDAERTAIKDAYRRLTSRELEADLRDEMSGSELKEAIALLNQGMLRPEDEVYLAMAGWGTDEARLFRVLNSMRGNQSAIEDLDRNYRDKYGDLTADLRGDLDEDEYRRAREIIGPFLPDVSFEDCSATLITLGREAVPVAIQQIDRALNVLAPGWARMSEADRGVFRQYFDPGHSGDIDAGFIAEVFVNFRAVRREFDKDFAIECETAGGLCVDTPARFTYGYSLWTNTVHLCPAFETRLTSPAERGRALVHEATHNALTSVDRSWTSESGFSSLTPRGTWASAIPIVGPLIRLIARSDTLYNPDSYAFFAYSV